MSAGGALQAALTPQLSAVEGVSGVYDGAPARAPFPYVVIDAGTEVDWSHKSGAGREVMVAVTVWDEQPGRLHALADTIEQQIRDQPDLQGWQLVTFQLSRRRVVRDVAGPWAIALDFRARLLAQV